MRTPRARIATAQHSTDVASSRNTETRENEAKVDFSFFVSAKNFSDRSLFFEGPDPRVDRDHPLEKKKTPPKIFLALTKKQNVRTGPNEGDFCMCTRARRRTRRRGDPTRTVPPDREWNAPWGRGRRRGCSQPTLCAGHAVNRCGSKFRRQLDRRAEVRAADLWKTAIFRQLCAD